MMWTSNFDLKCVVQLTLLVSLVATENQNRWNKLLLQSQSSQRQVLYSTTAILTVSVQEEDESIEYSRQLLTITGGYDVRKTDQWERCLTATKSIGINFFDPSAQSWLTLPIETETETNSPTNHFIQTATSFPKAKGKPVVFLGKFIGEGNTVTTTWRLETSSNSSFNALILRKGANFPYPNRFGYSGVAIKNKLLVWGGQAQIPGNVEIPVFNDLFSYDVDKDQWSEIKTTNKNPFAKAFHSAVAVADRYMIILGGIDYMLAQSDDGHVLDVDKNVWLELPDMNIQMREVVGQWGLFAYDQFYDWVLLTTEYDNRQSYYDAPLVIIYRFSLENVSGGNWVKLPIPKFVLPGLGLPKLEAVFNDNPPPVLTVEGTAMAVCYSHLPKSTSSFDNTLMFITGDSKQYHWELLPAANDNPGPLAGHSLTLASNRRRMRLYVYGGFSQVSESDSEGIVDGSVWRLDLDSFKSSRGVYTWEKYMPANNASRADRILLQNDFSTLRTLQGHSSVGIEVGNSTQKTSCFLIYGGIYQKQTSSDLVIVCPESFYSKAISREARILTWPQHRAYHSAVLIDQSTTMIIFGGIRKQSMITFMDRYYSYTPTNDMWRIQWTQSPPRIIDHEIEWTYLGKFDDVAPRFGHTAVFVDRSRQKQILIFGGSDTEKIFDDLWQFTLPSGPWKRIHYTTDFDYNNQLRLRHHTAVTRSRQMMVYGGCQTHPGQRDNYQPIQLNLCDKSRVSDRLFSYDMVTQAWKMHLALDAVPRYLHGMVLLDDDRIVIYGGIDNETKVSEDVFTLHPGCNMGEEGDFFTNGCRACDVGYYSSESGPSCDRCSLFFSTNSSGSTSADDCTVCSGICSYGGKCTVLRPNVEYECKCIFPFSGNTCGSFWPLLVFVASILATVAVATLIYKIVQYVKRARRDAKDLRAKDDEIVHLIDGWRIVDDEVRFEAKIGEGGFGEVWLAEYREMDVAVKILNENEQLFVANSQEQFQQEIDFMR